MSKLPSEILDRLPPQDLNAERSILGACLLQSSSIDKVADVLKPGDFYADANRKLFGHLLAMRDEDQAIDTVTLKDRLKAEGDLEGIGGIVYLAEVLHSVPVAAHVVYHAKIVADKAVRRKLIRTLTDCLQATYTDESRPVAELLAKVEEVVFRSQAEQFTGEPTKLADALIEVVAWADAIASHTQSGGLMTGLWDFDSQIGGLFPGELFILAARPRVGKTALACQVAQYIAGRGSLVYFASLEMGSRELVTRMLCGTANVDSKRIRTGALSDDDMAALTKTSNAMARGTMLIHDRPTMSVAEIRRTCRRLASQGLALVVVDYLQRITPPDRRLKRYEQVAEIAKQLKTLARELEVPVMCLAQLGRDAEKEGQPRLYHLRESGDIEAEADVVAMLWRPAPWSDEESKAARKGQPPSPDQAALIIEKNRNGETATLRMRWEGHRTRFVQPEQSEGFL